MPQIQNIKMSFLSDRKPSTVKGIRFKPKKALNKLGWSGLFLELLEMEIMEIWKEM